MLERNFLIQSLPTEAALEQRAAAADPTAIIRRSQLLRASCNTRSTFYSIQIQMMLRM